MTQANTTRATPERMAFKRTRRALLCACVLGSIAMTPAYASGSSDHIDIIRQNWVKAMMLMTEQLSATMMKQVAIIGSFFDVDEQLATQRTLQELTAEAHKDYQPSDTMCSLGSMSGSLYASDRKASAHTTVISEMLQQRGLLKRNMSSALGHFADRDARLKMVREIYCDPNDDYGNDTEFCASPRATSHADFASKNKDMNYTRVLGGQEWTLNADFTDTTTTADERDLLALARNLFSHHVMPFIPETSLTGEAGRYHLQDQRSLTAIRNVAEHSFAKIAADRASGTGLSQEPLRNFLQETLTVDTSTVASALGQTNHNPSYYAQMEVLTQKLYQSPEFYINLYDKPTNVARIGTALRAIQLMADRDKYETALRREMMISLLLELRLRNAQGQYMGQNWGSMGGKAAN